MAAAVPVLAPKYPTEKSLVSGFFKIQSVIDTSLLASRLMLNCPLLKRGFNSGWIKVMGQLSRNADVNIANELVNYPGSHYADPVFSWKNSVAVTDIEFMKSSALGQKYKNNIFVGDYNNGNLYYFEVNNTRTGIKPQAGLSALVVDNDDQLSAVRFGTGFGAISDIKTGPKDGLLYVLSINDGTIYKIVPSSTK